MEVDRWAAIQRELLEQSTRRIHEFERRLELEWEALRQLHEEPLKALPERSRQMRRALVALAAVLVASLAVAAFLYLQLVDRMREAERAAREAQERTRAESASLVNEVRKLTADSQAAVRASERMLAVLAAADVERFPLAGGREARSAAGQALWSRARGLVIDAARVPRPPAGEAHQAWLVTTRGSIGLGFVTSDAQGRVSASFDTPPELPGRVLGVMVTAEPTGGSGSPGRRIVLTTIDP